MARKYNRVEFYLCLFCVIASLYAFYSTISQVWVITPPNYILLLVTILAFILSIAGFKDKTNRIAKLRSWLTVVVSSLLIFLLFVSVLFTSLFSGAKNLIKTTHSPDHDYTVDLYRTNGGAGSSFAVIGELDGPLWFKKRIYIQTNRMEARVKWENEDTVTINGRTLNLAEGESYSE
ncbi:DUF5412 family protein [Virgibacillus flavescens]|uniref:DUF5412 family protein n=1 Tax=Virgibacillus flavescens TaxID=1611422 RepID=UPI003D354427